jgi:hypothetical protein
VPVEVREGAELSWLFFRWRRKGFTAAAEGDVVRDKYSGLGCGGRERLLKLLICRVAGSRAEGYLLFADGYPTEIAGVCLRADSRGKRKASKECAAAGDGWKRRARNVLG